MSELSGTKQLSLFPELSPNAGLRHMTSPAQFDSALDNLKKINEFGAFIHLDLTGLNSTINLDFSEFKIPDHFAEQHSLKTPFLLHLFPEDLRKELHQFHEELLSFFTDKNSFTTPSGYFLYRSHYSLWKHFTEKIKKSIDEFLYIQLSHGSYRQYFIQIINNGLEYIKSNANTTIPWNFPSNLDIQFIESIRKKHVEEHTSLINLKYTDQDFPLNFIVLKTLHFPLNLSGFISHVQIHTVFKSIHLEYLVDKSINSIDDINNLLTDI